MENQDNKFSVFGFIEFLTNTLDIRLVNIVLFKNNGRCIVNQHQ